MEVMCKSFIHAHLVVIDTLQFVEHLVHPGITSLKFGQDSLAWICIAHRDPPMQRLRRRDWIPSPWTVMLFTLRASLFLRALRLGALFVTILVDLLGLWRGRRVMCSAVVWRCMLFCGGLSWPSMSVATHLMSRPNRASLWITYLCFCPFGIVSACGRLFSLLADAMG